MAVAGAKAPFHHTNRNTLRKLAEPTPNPLAAQRVNPTAGAPSLGLGIGSLRAAERR
jgi:hypothetical protein